MKADALIRDDITKLIGVYEECMVKVCSSDSRLYVKQKRKCWQQF
mgnify:CR=1 FL=1